VAVRRGDSDGPHPPIARVYRLAWAQERALRDVVRALVGAHPTWPWLARVPGVGALAAGRLLARLDLARARTPSAFVAYCGLTTAPASRYACPRCGAAFVALTWVPPARHRSPAGATCTEALGATGRAGRVAAPSVTAGHGRRWDRPAHDALYWITQSLVRSCATYRAYFARHLGHYLARHPAWAPRRRELTALRAVGQLFLHHLWNVWRGRVGLPTMPAYSEARLGLRALPTADDVGAPGAA
jgi:hypothetical protein